MKRWLLVAWLCVGSAVDAAEAPWGTGESRPEDLEISLVTFSPGDDVPSWWGHTGLVVEDKRLGQARLYNYGMFSFDDKMLARFMLGRLEFWVGEDPVLPSYRYYQSENRDVRIQVLALPPEQLVSFARALATNVRPANRTYLYHHYNDNCSTRPRDAVDRAVGGQLKAATTRPGRMTLREHTRRYTSVNVPLSLTLDFLMNDEIDRPLQAWDEMFLPDELERQVGALKLVDAAGVSHPLVGRQVDFYRSNRVPPPERPPRWTRWVLLSSMLFAALAIGLALIRTRWGRVLLGLQTALFGLVVGVPGLVLFLGWLFTEHTVMHRNENLFWGNPLTFALVPFGLMYAFGAQSAMRLLPRLWQLLLGLCAVGVVAKLLPMFDQNVGRIVALIFPALLGLATATWLRGKKGTGYFFPVRSRSTGGRK